MPWHILKESAITITRGGGRTHSFQNPVLSYPGVRCMYPESNVVIAACRRAYRRTASERGLFRQFSGPRPEHTTNGRSVVASTGRAAKIREAFQQGLDFLRRYSDALRAFLRLFNSERLLSPTQSRRWVKDPFSHSSLRLSGVLVDVLFRPEFDL